MRLTRISNVKNLAALALCTALSITAPALTTSVMAQPAAPVSSTDKETATVTATVTAIDAATRTVTVRLPDGKSLDIKASDEVRNFPQIKVGDLVVATLQLSLTYTVLPIGTKLPDVMVIDQAARAKPGVKPGAAVAQSTSLSAVIVGVDVAAKTVSIVDRAGGPIKTLQVLNPERQAYLPKIKVGQVLNVTYTEAFALEVQPQAR
jgi:Cu/Ag efflux protein CusF